MRKLWPELASVDIESSDLPDLVALKDARSRIQEVFKANESDRAQIEQDAVFNPATQEREMDFRPGYYTREMDLPSVQDMADPDCTKLKKRQRHFSAVLNLGHWREILHELSHLPNHMFREKIRFISSSQLHSHSFLNALPTTDDHGDNHSIRLDGMHPTATIWTTSNDDWWRKELPKVGQICGCFWRRAR